MTISFYVWSSIMDLVQPSKVLLDSKRQKGLCASLAWEIFTLLDWEVQETESHSSDSYDKGQMWLKPAAGRVQEG